MTPGSTSKVARITELVARKLEYVAAAVVIGNAKDVQAATKKAGNGSEQIVATR